MICLADSRTNIPVVAERWRTMLNGFLFKERKKGVRLMDGKNHISTHHIYYDYMDALVEYNYKHNKISDNEYDRIKKLLNYDKSFSHIVLADKNEMGALANKMERESEKVKDIYRRLFVKLYKDFTQSETSESISIAHHFFRELDIRTCPYCNRQYTFTIDTETGKTAPEYDHFYDKSHYPILAVSFFNLIPSCHTCNHIKGTRKVKINPYFDGFESCFRLVDDNGKELNKAEILKQGGGRLELLMPNGKVSKTDEGNINVFGLKDLYSMHDDYIKEIIEKASAYNNSTIQQTLVDAFQSAAYSPQQVFDFVWGKYLEVSQYENRPLSKLTKDILEQLGIQR